MEELCVHTTNLSKQHSTLRSTTSNSTSSIPSYTTSTTHSNTALSLGFAIDPIDAYAEITLREASALLYQPWAGECDSDNNMNI